MKRLPPLNLSAKRGFVLVLTLAMILIAVMITGRTANRSLSRTMQSIEAESELQRRWEHLSLQRALLSRADQLFLARSELNQVPAVWYDGRFMLSGHNYRVRLSDESAKVNLNQLRRVLKPEHFRSVLASLPVRATRSEHEPIESWGQLFGSVPTLQLIENTTALTCWGDGRLNIERASDESILRLLEPVVGLSEVDALLRRRKEQRTSATFLPTISVPVSARNLVTDASRCHSLWIIDQDSEEVRLDIRELMDRTSHVTSFRW